MFVLKVINNERKILTRHEITDCIAEQIELVITRVCKESIEFIQTYDGQVSHLLIYESSLTFAL